MRTERISIGLVACAATKATSPQPARALYRSPLFAAASAYAERTYDHWFVLSAQHYLVHPDERLEPYDKTVARMVLADRLHWGRIVESGLRLGYGCLTDGRLDWPRQIAPRLQLGQWIMAAPDGVKRRVDVWFHAGANYVDAVRAAIDAALPYDVHTPMAHLGIGEQLAWYAQRRPPMQPLF